MVLRTALLVLLLAGAPALGGETLEEEVRELVAGLASDDFETRETSYERLEDLGEAALPWLTPALESEDPEVARLVARLVSRARQRSRRSALKALRSEDSAFPRSEEFERIVALGHRILPDVISVIEEEDAHFPSYSYNRLRNAYAVLARIVTVKDLDLLLKRLEHPNSQHGYLLRPILESFDNDIVLEKVLAVLGDTGADAQLRSQLLETCRSSRIAGNDTRIPALALELLEDEEPAVRIAAARYFLFKRKPEVLDRLLAGTKDEVPEVRAAILRALRSHKDPRVDAALRVALRDPEAVVRAAALETLRTSSGADLAPLIRPFLKDPDPAVRSNAAQALSRFGDKAALPTLLELLTLRDEEFLTRTLHSIVGAVGRMRDPSALEPLFALLEDAGEYQRIGNYRYLILQSIVFCGGVPVLDRVRPFLSDESVQNRHIVLDAVGQLQTEEVVPLLLDALKSRDRPMRSSAVRSLARRGHVAAAPLIAKALEEESDAWFLSEAVKALTAFDHRASVPRMRKLLDEGEPEDTRRIALNYSLIRAMVRFRVRAASVRIAELTAASSHYRYVGIDAIGKIGIEAVAPTLLKLHEGEKNDSLRYRIEIALARIGKGALLEKRLEALPNGGARGHEPLLALGRLEEARELLADTLKASPNDPGARYDLACALALSGEKAAAFEALKVALGKRSYRLDQLLDDPDFDSLHDDPRWKAILDELK